MVVISTVVGLILSNRIVGDCRNLSDLFGSKSHFCHQCQVLCCTVLILYIYNVYMILYIYNVYMHLKNNEEHQPWFDVFTCPTSWSHEDEGVTTTSKRLLRLFQKLLRQPSALNTTVLPPRLEAMFLLCNLSNLQLLLDPCWDRRLGCDARLGLNRKARLWNYNWGKNGESKWAGTKIPGYFL